MKKFELFVPSNSHKLKSKKVREFRFKNIFEKMPRKLKYLPVKRSCTKQLLLKLIPSTEHKINFHTRFHAVPFIANGAKIPEKSFGSFLCLKRLHAALLIYDKQAVSFISAYPVSKSRLKPSRYKIPLPER